MASTQPAPLTLLRVKRARTNSALDALHVNLPAKRSRRNGYTPSQQPLRFRRLPAAADLSTLGPSRVIDVDPGLLTQPRHEASSDSDTILYNGVPMAREFIDTDESMYDLFGNRDNPRLQHLLADEESDHLDENIAWLHANNLPIFDNDSSDEDLLSDSDDRSVDYPSTPELSVEQASEDEWREKEARILEADSQWQDAGSEDDDQDTSDTGHQWDEYSEDCESEQEGDNYDYEA